MSQDGPLMRSAYVIAAGVILIVLVVAAVGLRSRNAPEPTPGPTGAVATTSPTPLATAAPTAATATPTATPRQPSPSPTAAASPLPARPYVSAAVGYSMELKPPWHRAICGSSASGPLENSDGGDLFIAIPDRDFRFTDVGPNADHISVFARANPKGLTYREWKSSEIGGSAGETIEDVMFAGRPALLVSHQGSEVFLVANVGYMYAVSHQVRTGGTAQADRAAIVRSFRFLTTDEIAAARARATPSPAPRSVEAVADVLAEGFAKRDVTVLSRVIRPRCFSEGAYQAGVSSSDQQTYLDTLRDRFARGLAVDVQPRPITTRGEFPGTSFLRSTWREPGQPDSDIDMMIASEGATAYWTGTISYFRRP